MRLGHTPHETIWFIIYNIILCLFFAHQPKLGGLACQLLAGLAGPGIKKTKAFATILKSIDADFDSRLLEATATAPGCKCLRGAVITRLALALELEEERMKVRDAEKAMSGVGRRGDGGGPMLADDPFEGVPEEFDAEEFVKAYGEALRDLVHTQVNVPRNMRLLYTHTWSA